MTGNIYRSASIGLSRRYKISNKICNGKDRAGTYKRKLNQSITIRIL